jgi:hypothetical protein
MAGQITNFEALGRPFASEGFDPRLSAALLFGAPCGPGSRSVE